MELATVAIFVMLGVIFLLIGGIIGWLAQQNIYLNTPPMLHPEMFDSNGNVIPDEILAVRFENYYDNDEDYEDD